MSHPQRAFHARLVLPFLAMLLGGCGSDDDGATTTCLRLVGELPDITAYDAKPFGGACLVASGGHLALVDPVDGAPVVLDELALAGHCQRLAVEDSSAVAAAGYGGVFLVALSPTGGLEQIGRIEGLEDAVDADLRGSLVAVADEDAGIRLVDVTDPALPQTLSQIQITGGMWTESYAAVVIEGDRLYILSNPSGLSVFDITDPAAPIQHGTILVPSVTDFVVQDGWAFPDDDQQWDYVLRAVDLRNPALPRRAGAAPISPCSAENLCLDGDRLYVTGDGWYGDVEQSRLFEYDIANPGSPRLLGSLDIPDEPMGLGAVDGRVYVGHFLSGLGIYSTTCD